MLKYLKASIFKHCFSFLPGSCWQLAKLLKLCFIPFYSIQCHYFSQQTNSFAYNYLKKNEILVLLKERCCTRGSASVGSDERLEFTNNDPLKWER